METVVARDIPCRIRFIQDAAGLVSTQVGPFEGTTSGKVIVLAHACSQLENMRETTDGQISVTTRRDSKRDCGVIDDSNSEREIGRHDSLVFVLENRTTAGPCAFGNRNAKGGDQSGREQDGSD